MEKRYYWLKLQENFFEDKRVKKLRKIAGGDTYTVIYLKLILSTLHDEGIIRFEGVEDTLAEELGLVLNEDSDNVQVTISFLLNAGLLVDMGNDQYYLPAVTENLGSEGASAKRMRELRGRQKTKQIASQCDNSVTTTLQDRYGETDIEKETDIDIDKTDRQLMSGCLSERQQYIPSLEEVKAYAAEHNLKIDPVKFYEKNQDRGWLTKKGEPIKRWKSIMWSWSDNEEAKPPQKAAEANNKNSFQQNEYDFEALEEELRAN